MRRSCSDSLLTASQSDGVFGSDTRRKFITLLGGAAWPRDALIAFALMAAAPVYAEQAVKCLKPDGTEESCASRQPFFEPTKRYDAEGLEKLLPPPFGPTDKTFLGREQGGRIDQHIERWKALAASGEDVEIRGFCWSACTLVTAYIPKERLCFSKTAMLAFHLARFSNGEPSIEGSRWMFNAYPEDIRAWLRAKGGLEKMPLQGFWLMFPSELWQMGYRDCAWLGSTPGTPQGHQ
jgi:hypothetical protein